MLWVIWGGSLIRFLSMSLSIAIGLTIFSNHFIELCLQKLVHWVKESNIEKKGRHIDSILRLTLPEKNISYSTSIVKYNAHYISNERGYNNVIKVHKSKTTLIDVAKTGRRWLCVFTLNASLTSLTKDNENIDFYIKILTKVREHNLTRKKKITYAYFSPSHKSLNNQTCE